jgi:glutathione S-transferase
MGARPSSAAGSATSTPTRRTRSNTRSTATRWRSSASSTCSTAACREPVLAGDDYTIADIAVWPWYGTLAKGQLYGAGEFLQVQHTRTSLRWTDEIASARRCSAAAWSTAPGASPRASCTSATTQRLRDKTQDKLSPAIASMQRSPTMTTMTLYDCAPAPSPRRARILLAEKGVRHETIQSTCAPASSSARPSGA